MCKFKQICIKNINNIIYECLPDSQLSTDYAAVVLMRTESDHETGFDMVDKKRTLQYTAIHFTTIVDDGHRDR